MSEQQATTNAATSSYDLFSLQTPSEVGKTHELYKAFRLVSSIIKSPLSLLCYTKMDKGLDTSEQVNHHISNCISTPGDLKDLPPSEGESGRVLADDPSSKYIALPKKLIDRGDNLNNEYERLAFRLMLLVILGHE
ncbi:unnamed protein product [Didymodactylos carnosus]|uniref:Uncharacterized protein n=1 Tax=Didymodactylos carnosus TaxID=1234261 RepID=A0A8S2E2F5_9BILA|nr:unnamed protein product [Didymodactylos carnosus]CAF3800002.1 unnamed protein product [Didymodactylos carnosus]